MLVLPCHGLACFYGHPEWSADLRGNELPQPGLKDGVVLSWG